MKKWTLLCLLICFSNVLFFSVQANQSIPVGSNYLALNNLGIHPDNQYLASMINPISVEVDEVYTLVLSYGFIGQNASYIDYFELSIQNANNQFIIKIFFIEDPINERVYVEFNAPSNLIRLLNIPIDTQTNYEAILYKGFYQDFSGYIPFVNPYEVLYEEGVLLMNVDTIWSLSSIKALFTANDPLGSPLSIEVIDDSFSPSQKKPGSYQLTLQTTHNLITKKFKLNIVIYDITAPVLTLEETINIPLTEKIDVEDIISYVHISDNVDELYHHQITILEDNYSEANQVGEYTIRISIKDLSQNEAQLTIPVSIIDRNAPTASYPKQLFVYNTDAPLTNEWILSRFSINDDVDGANVSKEWTINQYNQTLNPGVYEMQLTTKDQSLNASTHIIYIHVIDNRAPIFQANDLILDMETHQHMTNEEIIDWFHMKAQASGLSISHVRILYNEYEMGNKQEGNYYVYLSYINEGIEHTSRIQMNVIEKNAGNQPLYIIISGVIVILGVSFLLKKKKKI